ncbi:hypothetical protein KI387_035150, partial [Taxus chinensis]
TIMDRLYRHQQEPPDLQNTTSVKQDSMDLVVRALAENFGIGKSQEEEEDMEEREETPVEKVKSNHAPFKFEAK